MSLPRAVLLILTLGGCGSVAEGSTCPPDAGCFCAPSEADVHACLIAGADWAPYCCTDRGGAIVQCGQPAGCLPKPGIEDAGAEGANWCCPPP